MKYRFANMVEKSNFTENEICKNINYTRFEQKKRQPDASGAEIVGVYIGILSQFLGMKNVSDKVNGELTTHLIQNPSMRYFLLFLSVPHILKDYIVGLYMDPNLD